MSDDPDSDVDDQDGDDGNGYVAKCGKCGNAFGRFGGGTVMVPMTDGLGVYYMARRCSFCKVVLTRFFPGVDRSLRDDLRKRAVKDPDPPSRSEIPDSALPGVDADSAGDDQDSDGDGGRP